MVFVNQTCVQGRTLSFAQGKWLLYKIGEAYDYLSLFLSMFFLFPDPISASNIELRNSFRGGANGFAFEAGKRTVSIPLGIRVSDWAVNCSRTRAIAWGQDLTKARIGAPPVNKIYVIDLKKRKPINHFTRTRGPYEAAFSRNHRTAIVDHDIVDLTTGKVVDVIYDMNLDLETCPSFPGKQSN